MDNVIAIGVGLALRAVIDKLTDSDYRLTGTLVGLWEGFVLSHFLHKKRRNPNDAYLALATRFVIDFLLTSSPVRLVLTGAWTLVGLLLADLAPSVWRETGLRHVYRALRKDAKAMRRSMPRWRIENDIRVPNISIANPVPGLLSRPPSSTIVSSTRAAPPASPAPILQRRSTSSSLSGPVTPSMTNTLTREVLLGPSPAFIHIDVDPDVPPFFNPDSSSPRPPLLSNGSGSDPSLRGPVLIQDGDLVHTAMPSHMQEQEQGDLSVLNITPSVAALEITATPEIISPTPRARIEILPHISDSEIDLSIHTPPVPPPEIRPVSRVRSLISTFGGGISSQNARTGVGEAGLDRGPGLGNVRARSHQRASSAGMSGQAATPGNQSNSTRQQTSSTWPNSMLRHPEQTILSDGAAGVGGFAIRTGGQMSQHSGTPQAHSGSDGVHTSSALGLNTPPSPSNTRSALTNPAPASAPQTKPPTPTLLARQTTPNLQSNVTSSNAAEPRSTTPAPALPSKPPTPPPAPPTPPPLSRTHTPIPPSKIPTPKPPKSRCTSPDLTSTSVRNLTDYDPANPIRTMPGLKSPSTEPDSIFPGPRARSQAAGQFNPLDTGGVESYDDPPPPFKEFESPVHPRGANFGASVDDGKGAGEQVAEDLKSEGAKDSAEAEGLVDVAIGGEGTITNKNIGDVDDVSGHDSGEGGRGTNGTSQDAGDHARGAMGPIQEEGAQENGKDSQEQEKNEQVREGNQGAVDESQAACEDANLASGDTQVAGDDNQGTDSAPKPEPTVLTPTQKEAETHRHAFLLKEVTRLEESRTREKLDSPDDKGPSEIQDRLSAVKARMTKINFVDPPRRPPPAFEVPSSGKSLPELTIALTDAIVELLLKRQDAGPIKVIVPYTKAKKGTVEKLLKDFNASNKFSIQSEAGQFSTVITV